MSLEGGGSVYARHHANIGTAVGGGNGWIDRQEKPRLGRSERFTFARNDLGGIKFYESSAIAVNNFSLEHSRVIAL